MDMEKMLMWLTILTSIALLFCIGFGWVVIDEYTTTTVSADVFK